ncbi:MAG: triose-phosphate isomerase [Deltaproteobacteria bacterium]|nr:triose-phosphate isomerase [Deltaproteobacteria bacterium]
MRPPLLIANWKMNMFREEAKAYCQELHSALVQSPSLAKRVAWILIPPLTALDILKPFQKGLYSLGAQNCHWEKGGAYTGEISPFMLADVGCRYVIAGHSERRMHFGESDEVVGRKVATIVEAGLVPILCIGEQWAERERGETLQKIERQLLEGLRGVKKGGEMVVAYEPVWAIGSGKTPSAEEIADIHRAIRQILCAKFSPAWGNQASVVYGGSVHSQNAAQFASRPEVNGFLVGGASLKVKEFLAIAGAFRWRVPAKS